LHGEFWQAPRVHLEAKGCPKCALSHGEIAVARYLDEHSIKYEVEYPIRDGKTNRNLRFDFYLPDRETLIEYDGAQHFHPVNFGGMSDEQAEVVHMGIKKRDKRKNEWARNNGLKLIRISYLESLTEKLDQSLQNLG